MTIFNTTQGSRADNNQSLYDLSKLEKISSGNAEFVKKMVGLFLEQAPAAVSTIKTACTDKQWKTLKAEAHKIKPGIDNMGIASLYKEIREIENYHPENDVIDQLEQNISKLDRVLELVATQLRENVLAAPTS